jgi:hypothetical protein
MSILNGLFGENHHNTTAKENADTAANSGQEITKRIEHLAAQDNSFDIFVKSLLRIRRDEKLDGKTNGTGNHY